MELFGLEFDQITFKEAVSKIVLYAQELKPRLVVTPNVDHIVLINKDLLVREIFTAADMVVADGMPIIWLSRLIPGKRLPERITGADLMPAVCQACAEKGLSVAFIGAKPDVARLAIDNLRKTSPNLVVSGYYSPPVGFEKDAEESANIVKLCNGWRPNVLFLCLGTPKQEKWARQHLMGIECGVIIGVGAAMDMLSGVVKRAPKFVQSMGMEWFWRLCQEPKRLWRRYLVQDTSFFYYALREIYRQRKRK